MTTKLEIAKSKLERIRNEQAENSKEIRKEHDRIPFAQPNIIGRRDIYKKVKQNYAKSRKLLIEEEKQENRVEFLETLEEFKQENELLQDVHTVGKTSYASMGAKTSVNNLDYFRNKLQELEKENEEAKAFNKTKPKVKRRTKGAEITKLKRKIGMLEEMEDKAENTKLSSNMQALIDSGEVNQWKKKPIYYFVKGLRKVALEIDNNGEFFISPSYPAYSENDKEFVRNLLEKE
ncbi:hypothetical protein D9N27_09240 [Listeria monocytogenes]|uniref:hypothetical protein n=1 Tax=Listeria seeligeri TaxID=1640 RepID=UPI0010B3EB8B|nr:hypothetical protein [Listeria seeligeri]EAC4184094.1 hypothetical protein [Listeria monocytogenes]EEO3421825.1 hypothetical protein [Listeria monocytogenes]MBF2629997.1 hypothetical protein [Listeria seeligeri]